MKVFFTAFFLVFLCSCASSRDPDFNVRRFTLANGLTCLLIKRDGAPVFSSYVRLRVGNIEESAGSSGLAHFFEHMAFKGTPLIGSRDYAQEKPLLDQIHALGTKIVQLKKDRAAAARITELQQQQSVLEDEHQEWVEKNAFVRLYQSNGGGDVNASTSNDYTTYYVSLPANKLELWAYLESERLLHPVFREFYKERDVVAEERRMRYDNNPDGLLYEAFMNAAFDNSPYKINVIGLAEDIQNYTLEAAREFRDTYYIPSRMVVALAGNFDDVAAEKYVRQYFGQLPARTDKERVILPETFTDFPREKIIHLSSQPRFYMGFHRPAHPHPDDEVFDVLEALVCEGRTSRLYSRIVLEKKLAADVGCYASLPDSRLDGLFSFFAVPLEGHTNREVQAEILNLLGELKNIPVLESELQKVQNQIEANLIWELDSNMGLVRMLSFFESLAGDWRYLYKLQERIRKIVPADVTRVAGTYFVPERRVTVFLEK